MTCSDTPKSVALVADDDEYFRAAIGAILTQRLGFDEVIEAGSYPEAIERLSEAKSIDLAVFDLDMPGMEGPSQLRTIRNSFDVGKLAVVSGSRTRSDILLSLEAGSHGFVSKGQSISQLQDALQQVLDGQMYVAPMLADVPRDEEAERPQLRSAAPERPLPRLTPRQREVLRMLVEAKSNKEIARALDLGPGTVKVHLAALFRNLGVSNRSAAAVAGAQLLRQLGNHSADGAGRAANH